MQLKAIIFDLDGVITDTAEFHFQAWRNMAKSIKIEINREFNEKLKGIGRMESLEKILEFGGVSDEYTDEDKKKLTDSKNEEYVKLLVNLNPEHIYPGIKELLEELRKRNIKIGLGSASRNAPTILKQLEITSYFDVVVDPATVEKGKPAPDIFLKAAEELGVAPEECIGIEDSEAGIDALKQAGMFAVGVGTKHVMEQAGADLVVEDTKDLLFGELLNAFHNRKEMEHQSL